MPEQRVARRLVWRRRIRAWLAAVAAAAAVGGVAGVAVAEWDGGQSRTVLADGDGAASVPWVDTPGRVHHLQPRTAPPCRAADLTLRLGRAGAWQGLVTQNVVATNTGDTACSLTTPTLRVIPASGPAADVGSGAPGNPGVVLDPTEEATVLLGAPGGCEGGAGDAAGATIELFDSTGGRAATPSQAFVPLACGKPTLVFMADQHTDVPSVPTAALHARIARVSEVADGRITFQVVLTNPTDHDISLLPCLSYSIVVDGNPATYQLNCAAVSAMAAGQAVTWVMQADLPAAASKLGWRLEVPGGTGDAILLDDVGRPTL